MTDSLSSEFIEKSLSHMDENLPRITKCLDDLSEEEVWKRPNKSSNSIGNLILHLCGNIRQYIISSLGKQPDTRERDLEFEYTGGQQKAQLIQKLSSTLAEAKSIIRSQDEESLLKVRKVQGFEHSGVGIIIHVTEHLSYHTGQIAFYTKLLKDKDLGFYEGLDLNAKNEQ